ncbi:ion transport protein [Nitzschia inconspicua]|uniref:Ion transport protein n=1 Tax=Nitzschia inconspicua TaxID=303405 RepID=A0A9K3LL34_9STRA|nr:ion transport protein [Nitzschia inconspicua]
MDDTANSVSSSVEVHRTESTRDADSNRPECTAHQLLEQSSSDDESGDVIWHLNEEELQKQEREEKEDGLSDEEIVTAALKGCDDDDNDNDDDDDCVAVPTNASLTGRTDNSNDMRNDSHAISSDDSQQLTKNSQQMTKSNLLSSSSASSLDDDVWNPDNGKNKRNVTGSDTANDHQDPQSKVDNNENNINSSSSNNNNHSSSISSLAASFDQSSCWQEFLDSINQFRYRCGMFVNNGYVQFLIIVLIGVNAIMMGLATFDFIKLDPKLNGAFETTDYTFLIVFTVELGLQFIYHGLYLLLDGWLVFDLIIIVTSWSFSSVQIIRAFRIFRALRLVTRIKILKNLILAMFSVIPRMAAIGLMLCLIFYIFGVLFTQLFKNLYEEGYTEHNYFSDLDWTFFTLFQMMTLDNWADISREVVEVYQWAWIPFVLFVIICGFIVVNLIIAVICDAIGALHSDQKAKLHGDLDDIDDDDANNAQCMDIREQLDELEDYMEELTRIQSRTFHTLQFLTQQIQMHKLKQELQQKTNNSTLAAAQALVGTTYNDKESPAVSTAVADSSSLRPPLQPTGDDVELRTSVSKEQRRRRKSQPATAITAQATLALTIIVCHLISTFTYAFIPTQFSMRSIRACIPQPHQQQQRQSKLLPKFRPTIQSTIFVSKQDDKEKDDDDLLSDLDARVLRSMLQDSANKLDLQQEENMKKLLERGIKSKQKVESPTTVKDTEKEEESAYSSQVIKTLADTKLWRALSRNAQDFLESAKITIANRLERDAKLVVSLGIFALDRALQDVSRALPSAASLTQNNKKIFQLSDKSSFDVSDNQQQKQQEPMKVDLRKEFATPQDEIKSVSAAIKQIFEQADQKVTPRSLSSSSSSAKTLLSSSSASSLKSTAQRGTARLSSAYQRQQKTKLAREKENIVQKAPRLASSVIDSAYQVKRELQIEPNKPGYKTQRLREATASTAKLLASAAKAGGSLLLGQASKTRRNNQLPFSATSSSAVSTNAGTGPSQVDVKTSSFTTNGATISEVDSAMDATARAMDAAYYASSSVSSSSSSNNGRPNIKAEPVDFLDNEPYFAFKRGGGRPTTTIAKEEIEERQETPGVWVKDAETKTQPPKVITVEFQKSADGVIEGIDPSTIDAFDETYYLSTEYGYCTTATTTTAMDDDDMDNLRQVTAEVISEEDFESVFGRAKAVDNLGDVDSEYDDDDNNSETEEGRQGTPNLLVVLTLRSLDVVFLVVEKAVLLLPDVLAFVNRVATRAGEVSREGMGQIGWQPLKTNMRGAKRY